MSDTQTIVTKVITMAESFDAPAFKFVKYVGLIFGRIVFEGYIISTADSLLILDAQKYSVYKAVLYGIVNP